MKKKRVEMGKTQTKLRLENRRRTEKVDYFSEEGINPKNEGVAFAGTNDFLAIYDRNLFILGNSLSPSK